MMYQRELDFATAIAREAGAIMQRYFRADDIGTEWKEDATPITVADLEINDFVIGKVKDQFPTHGVHGEEASFGKDRKYIWVCDPVDGTMPFSLGLPISTFSIALVKDGEPLLGVVYDPFCDRLFTATKGAGAFLNGKPLHISSQKLAGAYVDLEMIHTAQGAVAVNDLRDGLSKKAVKTFTLFSFVMGAMMVASGDFVAAFFGFRKPEDLAAAKVIIEEAGGKVTDIDGNDQLYNRAINGALVSNGIVHDELLDLIRHAKSPTVT